MLELLRLRGLTPSPELEGTVLGCDDVEKLQRWLARALTIEAADDLLE